MLLIQLMTIFCPNIWSFMWFFDLLGKIFRKWPKTGFFCKTQFLAIFGFFYLTNQKNTINIKWWGIKSSLFMLVTLGQNFQSKYEKKLKPKNHLLFAKANESSFFLHSLQVPIIVSSFLPRILDCCCSKIRSY